MDLSQERPAYDGFVKFDENCWIKLLGVLGEGGFELQPIQKKSKKGSRVGGEMGKCNKKLITPPSTPTPLSPSQASKMRCSRIGGSFKIYQGNQLLLHFFMPHIGRRENEKTKEEKEREEKEERARRRRRKSSRRSRRRRSRRGKTRRKS